MAQVGYVVLVGKPRKVRAATMPPGASGHVTEPVTWPGWPRQSGWVPQWDPQTPWLSERVGILYACVERVASALSAMPLRVSKDSQPQPEPVWVRNPDPNWYTHSGDAVGEIVWSLLMHGNAYLLPTVTGNDGYPLRWLVLDPGAVSHEQRDPGGEGWWRVNGRRVPIGGLVHIRHMPRPGQRLGLSPLDAVRRNLGAVAAYERMAEALGTESGLPTSGILSTDQDIPEDTATRYKKKWMARTPGDVAVLGSGLRYESLTLSPRDLALLELREFDGRAIATVFGVPPFMVNLAAAGDLTYSTVQGMTDFFWRQTLRPMADNIGRALGTMLPGRSTVEFDSDAYTRGTQAEHTQSLVAAVGGPFLHINEARASVGLSPVPALPAPGPVGVDA